MKKEKAWTFPLKISTLTLPCRRGILTRPQVGYFQVAIRAIGLHKTRKIQIFRLGKKDLTNRILFFEPDLAAAKATRRTVIWAMVT
jgi:hypothetical protein